MFWRKKKNLARNVIEPDEIFMDSANLPGFERELFEGRIEKPLPPKIHYIIFLVFLFISLIAISQLVNLQAVQHDAYLTRAENNTLTRISLRAERGLIYDRNMKEIAWNSADGRSYWKQDGLSHVLGYMGYTPELKDDINPDSKIGRAGVEMAYDKILRGTDGSRLSEENAEGKVVSEGVELEPKDGKSIVLTVDAEMQSELFTILKTVAEERGFKAGSGVVIDIQTGEILSAASFPEFSSEVLSKNTSTKEVNSYLENNARPFFFRAFEGLYAPGSVFKPIVALAALAEDIISPTRQILSTGSISIPNPYFPDKFSIFYDWKSHGWVDMIRAIAVSSNVYFYTIGGGFEDQAGVGVEKIVEYAKRMGLGQKVGVELKEAEGFLPTPEWKEKNDAVDSVWRLGDTYNLSIGQGYVQVTPLQMASVVSAIAGDGEISQIHLVKGFLSGDKFEELKYNTKTTIEIPKDVFTTVKDGMRAAVLDGTASALSGLGVDIAGKTGTAELGLQKSRINSWFIGFMPYNDPKIALAVVLESGDAHNLVGAPYAAREFVLKLIEKRPELINTP